MSTDGLVQRAQKTALLLREHATEGDRVGRLPRASFDALRTGGFFRMLTPSSLGGAEADPVTVARTVEEIARADAAGAWALMVASSGAWPLGPLPERTVAEIFADPDMIIASAFTSPVQAVAEDGGYRLNGRSPFASYMRDAKWALATAIVGPMRPDAPPQMIAGIVPREEVEVVETWNGLGMRATDSNDVVFRDVHVPSHRAFPLGPGAERNRHYRGPLYQLPAMASSVGATISATALGIGAEALDEVAKLAAQKTPFSSRTLLRDRPTAQHHLGRAEGLLRSSRAYLHAELAAAFERAQRGEQATLEQRSHMLLASVQAVQASSAAVDLAYSIAGASAVYETSRLARLFRDAQVVRQHGLVSDPRYQTVGQIRLGLPPEMALVAL